jgi:hypothetical protein
MRNLKMPALAAVIITVAACGALLVQSNTSHANVGTLASVTKNSAASGKHWLIPTQEYLKQYPPTQQTSGASPDIPADVPNGPASEKLKNALVPVLAPYTNGPAVSVSDEQGTANPAGTVKWRAKAGGGEILATMQQLTKPLPIGTIGGDDSAPVGQLPSGSEYIIIEHAPFFRQLIVVKPSGMFVQVTNSIVPTSETSLGISQNQLVQIATAIDASSKL